MQRTLEYWENTFQPYFAHITLLGEIPLTRIECEEIGLLIRELVKKQGPTKGTRQLSQNYPKTFAVFLAMTAAHNTKIDYWGVISEIADISKQQINNQRWGQVFLDVLNGDGLPEFSELQSYKFVGPIRLHGGIPAYSLPDFFYYILLPSVNNPKYNQLPTPELIDLMLKRSTIQQFVDSPVTNFLDKGEDVAIDFVDRCRHMVRKYKQEHEISSPDALELPPYIVRTFRQYVDEELEVETGRRYRAPWLQLHPWGPDFYLHLPSQQIEGVLAAQQYFWKIELRNRSEEVVSRIEEVQIRRRGYDLETNEVELPLEVLAQRITVSFCTQAQSLEGDEAKAHTLRRWQLNLMPTPDQPPLLVFNPDSSRIAYWNQYLPSDELWLLYPEEIELEINGDEQIVEEFPRLFINWGIWRVTAYDFSRAFSLQLLKDGRKLGAPIPFRTATDEPQIIGENKLTAALDPDDIPVFIGDPPNLKLPLRPGRSVGQELDSWKVRIASRWAASPVILNQVFELGDYWDKAIKEENYLIIPLKSLMGEKVIGTFDLHVNGPYHSQCDFRFRCWNQLSISNLEKYYLPTKEGAPTATILLTVPDDCRVETQAGVEGVKVINTGEYYRVTIDPEVTVADFHLVAPTETGDPVRMPLSLAIPRLRWTVRTEQFDEELAWYSIPAKTPIDEFLQAEIASLHLELPLPEKLPIIFSVLLVDPETGTTLQEHVCPQEIKYRQTKWRFALGEFSDTLRELDDLPIFEFHLSIENAQTGQIDKIPVIRMSRNLNILGVWIEHLDPPEFKIHWQEPKPLRNRRVQIWSSWQPWTPPTEIKIPDDAREEILVKDVGLPPSQYQFHFITALPWERESPPFNPPELSHVVPTADPKVRIRHLRQDLDQERRKFLTHFELACVYLSSNDLERHKDEVKWCYQNLAQATPDQILSFHNWLELFDADTQKAVRIQMYRPSRLKKLFEVYPKKSKFRDKYLAGYLKTSMIKPESALLLLENENDPALVMHSMLILFDRKAAQVITHLYERLAGNELSDQDAINLLQKDPDFSIPEISKLPENDMKMRLVNQIATQIPEQKVFATTGMWIRSDAGWGIIRSITINSEDKPYFDRTVEKPVLVVTLRPDKFAENVIIDFEEDVIRFSSAKKVYLCRKDECNFFASEEMSKVLNEHNRASHGGLGPAFCPSNPEFYFSQEFEYSPEPPENQYE